MAGEIRKAATNDLDACARLIYLSGPHLYEYIYVLPAPQLYLLLVHLLKTDGMYSMRHVFVEAEGEQNRGMCLAYPAKRIPELTRDMALNAGGMLQVLGLWKFIVMLSRLGLNAYFPPTTDDEYFISNIAVFEAYRGKGIATALLENAAREARTQRIARLSLYVETDNTRAVQFYQSIGFREEKRVDLPASYRKHGIFGFLKMAKDV